MDAIEAARKLGQAESDLQITRISLSAFIEVRGDDLETRDRIRLSEILADIDRRLWNLQF